MSTFPSDCIETLGPSHHGGLLYDGIVRLLQVSVQDVAQQAGRVLVQVARTLGHTVILAAERDVDALFL